MVAVLPSAIYYFKNREQYKQGDGCSITLCSILFFSDGSFLDNSFPFSAGSFSSVSRFFGVFFEAGLERLTPLQIEFQE